MIVVDSLDESSVCQVQNTLWAKVIKSFFLLSLNL